MTPEVPPPSPAPRRQPTPLWKRLPLIAVGLFGIWLWRGGGGLVSTERTLVWKVEGAFATVRRVEGQLWDGEELLTRFELQTPSGLGGDPERRLPLRQGHYRSELLVWREGDPQPQIRRAEIEVSGDPTVVIR